MAGAARGDIVTFGSPADGTRLLKRVVGLPGDRV
ncbi:MAG: S26 family signal peptidase [Inhella sp.]